MIAKRTTAILALAGTFLTLGLLPPLASRQNAINSDGIFFSDGRTPISTLPFTVDRCGSYFLTDCLTGVSGRDGITIDADDVTLDLNGFALLGVPGSLDGVRVAAGRRNARVCNGTVRGWGGTGVSLGGETGSVTGVRASENGDSGIFVGSGASIEDCIARGNQGDGFLLGFGSSIADSVATGNQGNGIHLAIAATATGCTAIGCTVRGNAASGVVGGDGCVVQNCSATLNGQGISVGVGCVVEGCSTVFNGGTGIASFGSLVRGNSSQGNGGLQIDAPGSTVIENH